MAKATIHNRVVPEPKIMIDGLACLQSINSKVIVMITAAMIPKQERLTFYPSTTKQFRFLKRTIHRFSELYLKGYYRKGGRYWQFLTLSNGGRFAYPVMEAPVTFYDPNHDTWHAFSQEAAGICIWLVTLRTCATVALERDHFVEMDNFSHYHSRLMEYANE
ncbi:antirestriction protein, partial [Vibrio parahaemolyticus]|nr:antirestriction protein [Vibrio parahaemolyticus]